MSIVISCFHVLTIMSSERLLKQMEFIVEIDKAKQVLRQAALNDGSRQENDAEHSWHIALMAFILSEHSNHQDIDTFKVVKMLLIHDIVEIDAGDMFVYDIVDTAAKFEKEKRAADRIFGILPEDQAKDLLDVWLEFEDEKTPEAKFAKALDALQPLLQGFQNRGWSWQTHDVSQSQVLEQKEPMKEGSKTLWEYAKDLLHRAGNEGYFPRL